MPNDPTIAILILAAGSSARMGRSKQLLEVDQKPLLLKAAQTAIEVRGIEKVAVVLGARAEEHTKLIQGLPIEIVINPDWQNGMGSSLKKGLSYLLSEMPALAAVIVMVCDQPAVNKFHIEKLIRPYLVNPASIVASHYGDTIGVPALFSSTFFNSLQKMEDGQGARKVIQEHSSEVIAVELPEGEIDLDTPADYTAWINREKKS